MLDKISKPLSYYLGGYAVSKMVKIVHVAGKMAIRGKARDGH